MEKSSISVCPSKIAVDCQMCSLRTSKQLE